jgi:hypothetical protein
MKLAGVLRALAAVGSGLAVFLVATSTQGAHPPDLRTLEAALLGWMGALTVAALLAEGTLGATAQAQLFLAPVATLGVLYASAAQRMGTLDALGAIAPGVGLLAFGHGSGCLGRERSPEGRAEGWFLATLAAAAVAALAIGVAAARVARVAATLHLSDLTRAAGVLLALGLVSSAAAEALPEPAARVLASPGLSALVLLPSLAALEHPLSLLPPFPAAHWLLAGLVLFCAGWVEGRIGKR